MRKAPSTPVRTSLFTGLGLVAAGLMVGRAMQRRAAARPTSAVEARVEEELQALREKLDRQAREARRMDHEFRTPIGAVAAAVELLSTSPDAALQAQARQVISRQLARMTALTEELRELARDHCEPGGRHGPPSAPE
ncbi:hypothetical protein J7E62_08230 [Variovorax paradoxus]|nr:hypothetical protein [Variovorax paradoxus]